ncbi:MAG TPA: flagellar filament capping protein FliD [Acidobacteriaceae bacterium]|nr:flagellar filament capping protein FliD [Acidobacteriaceae bacterium]
MGSIGISFGSPTSGQGFDVSSTVSQIVANLQAIETPWQTQISTLQSQDTVLTSIGSDLNNLSNTLQNLTDFEGVLSGKEGSSSDTSVLQLISAASNAVAGSHTVVVNSLAQTSSYYSDAVSSTDTLSGSITLSVGSGTAQTITLDSTDNTIATLADAINSGNYGVAASVITDGSTQRLSLVSNTSGAAGDINLTSALTDSTTSAAVNFTQAQAGQDAQFTVDGISATSSSNTVSNVIPGVTFQLLSASPGTSIQIEITNDNSSVESVVNNFVSAYNTVITDINSQEQDDASGNPEPLFGSPTLSTLQEELQQALDFTQPSGAVTSLTQLGVSVNNDGTLSLNVDTLDSELNSNYQDVVNFFQPSGSFTSFGSNFSDALNNLGNSTPSSLISLALSEDSTQESALSANISNENTQISSQEASLTTELNEANYTLEEIPSQLDYVNELYSAITGYNENTNG